MQREGQLREMWNKFSIKYIPPMKLFNCGVGHCVKVWTLNGSRWIPSLSTTNPNDWTDFYRKNDVFYLTWSLCLWSSCRTQRTWCMCSSHERLNIWMSSRYMTTNVLRSSLKISLINCMNVVGAFVRPNGITFHSKMPNFILNFVFQVSSLCICTWWYPTVRSIFMKNVAPCKWSMRSII